MSNKHIFRSVFKISNCIPVDKYQDFSCEIKPCNGVNDNGNFQRPCPIRYRKHIRNNIPVAYMYLKIVVRLSSRDYLCLIIRSWVTAGNVGFLFVLLFTHSASFWSIYPLGRKRKLHVHKMFRKCSGRSQNALYIFSSYHVPREYRSV